MKTRNISMLEPIVDDFVEKFLDFFGDKFEQWESQHGLRALRNTVTFKFNSVEVSVRCHSDYGTYHVRVHLEVEYKQVGWVQVQEGKDYSQFFKKVLEYYESEKIKVANDSLIRQLKEYGKKFLEELGLDDHVKVLPSVYDGKKYSETKFNYEVESSIERLGEEGILEILKLIKNSKKGRIKVSLYFEADDLKQVGESMKKIKPW